MSDYRSGIIDLASRAVDTNEPFRRMLNYAEIQYSYCLWGRMPGSVTDEESPFNECAHAYLAATKAVLLSMREMPREGLLQAKSFPLSMLTWCGAVLRSSPAGSAARPSTQPISSSRAGGGSHSMSPAWRL